MSTIANQQNADAVLFDLVGAIQNFSDSICAYLHHIGEQEVFNPFRKADFTNISKPIPYEFFERSGIHRLILNAFPGRSTIADDYSIERDKERSLYKWNSIKNEVFIEELRTLFSSCDIIQFTEWASVDNASDFWDGLLTDVIKPVNKKDFQFIFYLGDPTKKFVFETDEILDIISEYSLYGKVTLVLDDNEADSLWNILNGLTSGSTQIDYKSLASIEKYMSIFKTMRIDFLIVFCANRTVLISKEQRFELAGRSLNSVKTSKYVRDCFDAGYQLGLLLQLKIAHCIGLGLTISGAYLENGFRTDQRALLKYIKEWIYELKMTDGTTKNELQQAV